MEYERRVRRRRARLTVAAEEAFAHIKRLQREPGMLFSTWPSVTAFLHTYTRGSQCTNVVVFVFCVTVSAAN